METKLYNIPANTLRPGPTLTIVRDADGKTTATMEFTCRKYDVGKPLIQAKLRQGTTLISLYPQAGTEFGYLLLHSWTSRDEPGGITTITCDFGGVDLGEGGDFSFDSSIVYTRNNSLKEESIFNHADFLSLPTGIRTGIKAASDGLAYLDGTSIKYSHNDQVIVDGVDAESLEIYDLIVTRENTTYLVATSEWTKSATGRGGISNATLLKFGKIDTPPGNPGAPDGHTWLFTGATEQISVLGSGQNSYSLTWTSGVWPEWIYAPAPAP